MSLYSYVTNLIDGVLFRADHINNMNDAVKTAFEKVETDFVSKGGGMTQDLDVHGNKIINLPAPSSDTEPMRKADMAEYSKVNHTHPGGGAIDYPTLRTMIETALNASATAITRDANGALQSVTETVFGLPRVTTITRDPATAAITSVSVAYNGVTRTQIITRDEFGNISAIAVTEV